MHLGEEQASEEARQHLYRQEEALPTVDPTLAVERKAAAGRHAMDMGVMLQGLAPGVQDGGDAKLGAEMPWIGGDS